MWRYERRKLTCDTSDVEARKGNSSVKCTESNRRAVRGDVQGYRKESEGLSHNREGLVKSNQDSWVSFLSSNVDQTLIPWL